MRPLGRLGSVSASDLKSLAEIAALIVGGIWTYILFLKGRTRYPRATVAHRISHHRVPQGKVLVRITAVVSNTGVVVMSLDRALFRIQQVVPLPPDALDAVEEGRDLVREGELEVDWSIYQDRSYEWQEGSFEIEPGETDEVSADFVVGKEVGTVQLYSYFRNVKKRDRQIGWGLTTMYELETGGGASHRKVEDVASKERGR